MSYPQVTLRSIFMRILTAVVLLLVALIITIAVISKGDLSWLVALLSRGEHNNLASLLSAATGITRMPDFSAEIRLVIIFGIPFVIPAGAAVFGSIAPKNWKFLLSIVVPAICLLISFWYAFFASRAGLVDAYFMIQFPFSSVFWTLYLLFALYRLRTTIAILENNGTK